MWSILLFWTSFVCEGMIPCHRLLVVFLVGHYIVFDAGSCWTISLSISTGFWKSLEYCFISELMLELDWRIVGHVIIGFVPKSPLPAHLNGYCCDVLSDPFTYLTIILLSISNFVECGIVTDDAWTRLKMAWLLVMLSSEWVDDGMYVFDSWTRFKLEWTFMVWSVDWCYDRIVVCDSWALSNVASSMAMRFCASWALSLVASYVALWFSDWVYKVMDVGMVIRNSVEDYIIWGNVVLESNWKHDRRWWLLHGITAGYVILGCGRS